MGVRLGLRSAFDAFCVLCIEQEAAIFMTLRGFYPTPEKHCAAR